MSTTVKLRRGTTTEHSTFTGAQGEVTVDTTKNTAVVHNGTTPGGFPLVKEASIGVTVQAYDANTTKNNVSNTFTTNQVIADNSSNAALRINQTGTGNALVIEDAAFPDTTPFVVDGDGAVIVGNLTKRSSFKLDAFSPSYAQVQIEGVDTFTSALSVLSTASSAVGATLALGHIRNTSAIVNNDLIGKIDFVGYDGSVFTPAARIAAYADATTGSNDMPGRLEFSTTTDGGTSLSTRLTIDNAGNINQSSSSSLKKNGINAFTLKNITYLTSGTAATYNPPTGVRALKVTVVGGGGGGGGVDGQGASTYAVSSGGAGGGWAEALITSIESSYTYTVGAGGTGGLAGNNAGTAGGTSEFKNSGSTVVISATGGAGGSGDLGAASAGAGGVLGGIGSLTGITGVVSAGVGSTYSRVITSTYVSMSQSGGSRFGGGQTVAQPGASARVYGEGGGATYAGAVTTNYAGGNGFQGVIIVEEYY